jgi:hypothetical protein
VQVRRGGVDIEADEIVSHEDRLTAVRQLLDFDSPELTAAAACDELDESLITPVFTKVRQLGKIAISLGQVISSYARV